MAKKSNLIIKNVDAFILFLNSIVKLAEDGQFVVTPSETSIHVKNEGKTIRSSFRTNSLVSENDVEFNFQNIQKLLKSIKLIKDVENLMEAKLNFTGVFIKYDNKINFKLRTVKQDVISKFFSPEIKTKFNSVYNFDTTSQIITKIVQTSSIINDIDTKIYFSKKDDNVIAEIDNKKLSVSDSIGLPLSNQINGNIDKVVCIPLESFKNFALLPTDNINISLTDKNIFEVNSKVINNNSEISMRLMASTIKMD